MPRDVQDAWREMMQGATPERRAEIQTKMQAMDPEARLNYRRRLVEEYLKSKDKDAKKRLGKRRRELMELREQVLSGRKKQEAVGRDPELKRLAEAHPKIAADARRETAKRHEGGPENTRLWSGVLPARDGIAGAPGGRGHDQDQAQQPCASHRALTPRAIGVVHFWLLLCGSSAALG